MAKFMLLLNDTQSMTDFAPEEMQKVIEKYNSWSGKLAQAGKLVGGEKLTDEGGKRVVKKKGAWIVTDGPYSETKEVIGGYFTVEAASYAEAVELAKSCPHLDYGGVIDVRMVEDIPS